MLFRSASIDFTTKIEPVSQNVQLCSNDEYNAVDLYSRKYFLIKAHEFILLNYSINSTIINDIIFRAEALNHEDSSRFIENRS